MDLEEVPREEQLRMMCRNREVLSDNLAKLLTEIGSVESSLANLQRKRLDVISQLEVNDRVMKGGFSVEERNAARSKWEEEKREEAIGREEVDLTGLGSEDMH